MRSSKLKTITEVLEKQKDNPLFSLTELVKTEEMKPLSASEMHVESARLIKEAKKEVCMQFYKLEEESYGGKLIIDAIKELQRNATAAKQRVTVNVIVNIRGKLAELLYRPNKESTLSSLQELDNGYFTFRLIRHVTSALGSFHSKLMVVDNEKGMIRGGDPAINTNLEFKTVETAALVSGSLARAIKKEFSNSWERLNGTSELGPLLGLEEQKIIEIDTADCIFISKRENGNPLSLTYSGHFSPYKCALLTSIKEAKESIKIMTANLNDLDICKELANACQRGVKVQIIMGKHTNDKMEKKIGGTNTEIIVLLMQMIPKKYQIYLDVRWHTNEVTTEVVRDEGNQYKLHGKFCCIDDSLVLTGSAPLDKQAMSYSREADIIFENPKKAKAFTGKLFTPVFTKGEKYFKDIFQEIHKEITRLIELLPITVMRTIKPQFSDITDELNHPDFNDAEKIKLILSKGLSLFSKLENERKALMALADKHGFSELDLTEKAHLKKEPIQLKTLSSLT